MITTKDIFTDKQYEETFGTGDMIPAPIVTKQEFQLLDLDTETGMMTLMGQVDGEIKEDLNLPEANHMKDICKEIKKCFDLQKKEALITVQIQISEVGRQGSRLLFYSFREGAEMWDGKFNSIKSHKLIIHDKYAPSFSICTQLGPKP